MSAPLIIKQTIGQLIQGRDLDAGQAAQVMQEIMVGAASEAQIAGFLTALQGKGARPHEIAAFARVMREFSTPVRARVHGRLVDTCGTGGDHQDTFNVSTASALTLAGGGVYVAKHGNRSVSSGCGSADVLQALGVNIEADPDVVARCIEEVGIGFLLAPRFHPAMKHALKPRREIGIPTVFNILGPLTNPAAPSAQVLGVYTPELVEPIAAALRDLGVTEAMVVHGAGGLDEIAPFGTTLVAHLRDGRIEKRHIKPRDAGLEDAKRNEEPARTVEQSAEHFGRILRGQADPFSQTMVLLNAAAGFVVAGRANGLREGAKLAEASIAGGAALLKLRALVQTSGGDLDKLGRFIA